MNIVAAVSALAIIGCVLAMVAATVFEIRPFAHHPAHTRTRRRRLL